MSMLIFLSIMGSSSFSTSIITRFLSKKDIADITLIFGWICFANFWLIRLFDYVQKTN